MSKLYVGNLSYQTSESELREIFSQHGEVVSATLVMDRETGRPRGFGFVEFADASSAKAAIEALTRARELEPANQVERGVVRVRVRVS